MSEIAATASTASTTSEEMTIGYEQLLATLDQLDVEELATIMDRASTLLKKAIGKVPLKKKGTGVVPPQLEQNHEWVRYVLGDARLNGWESFEMSSTKTDKSTGEKIVEVVTMAGSVEREDKNVFADTGKEFTQKDAMSYSKILKDRKDELYQTFLEEYSMQAGPKKDAIEKVVVKKTSAELEQEKAAKAAEKEREKAEKAAEKEREKAAKAAEKEREKAEKAAEKAREKAEKDAVKKPEKKVLLVPVKRERSQSPAPGSSETATAATAEVLTPQKKIAVKKPMAPVKAARPEVDPFVAEEGELKQWEWNGKVYVRDGENYVWAWNEEEDDTGDFQGRYNYKLDAMEDCEEPITEEDE